MTTEMVRHVAREGLEFTADQRQMIRDAYANGASDDEFAVLLEIAKTRRLNPLLRQIHFVKRWNTELRREVWAAQVSIDGLRAIAERTGLYAGQDEPEFVENPDGTLKLCKVRVYRSDWPTRPAVGVAHWSEYVQTFRDKATGATKPTPMWARMPHVMLAKVAESIAIRKAFPEDVGGLYSPEEMAQADSEPASPEPPRKALPRATVKVTTSASPALPASADPHSAGDLDGFRAQFGALKTREDAALLWVDWRDRLRAEGSDIKGWGELAGLFAERAWKAEPHARGWLKSASQQIVDRRTLPDNDPPSGPSGGARRAQGATATDASGSAQESHGSGDTSASVTALPGVPEWATTPGGIRAHLASLDHVRHLENSARLHGARLGAAYVEPAAERLIALDGPDAHGLHLALSTARGMVAAWAAAGPRPKAETARKSATR